MIVLDDAHIGNAARAAVWGAFCNSGQACASIERCYVHESIATQFIEQVVAETARLKQGAATSDDIDVGAMTNERQLRIVEEHIKDAVERGAQIRIGGKRLNSSAGWFHEPTVLTNANHSMKIMRDETFGPVLPIMTFSTDDEAVRLANDSIYGLTACVFTSKTSRGRKLAEEIEAGTVMVNEVVYTHALAQTPWEAKPWLRQDTWSAWVAGLSSPNVRQCYPAVPDVWWFPYRRQRSLSGLETFTTSSLIQDLLLPQM